MSEERRNWWGSVLGEEDGGGVGSVDMNMESEGIEEINMEQLLSLSYWDECCDAAAVELLKAWLSCWC